MPHRRLSGLVVGQPHKSMNNITHPAMNCKTWVSSRFEDIRDGITHCVSCDSDQGFSFVSVSHINYWDIDIPEDWSFGEWDRVVLVLVPVPIYVAHCLQCDCVLRIVPSFLIRGTRLTLPALIFMAFVYETMSLSWRKMAELFCPDQWNRIAHSTLYGAVHGLGQTLMVKNASEALIRQFCPKLAPLEDKPDDWPPPKSVMEHTISREGEVRSILRTLRRAFALTCDWVRTFWRYVIGLTEASRKRAMFVTRLY